jgi:hypothetical protein
MIDDLDEVLQQLLIREIPIKNSEIDIMFHQPKREWSARLNRPTLNLFLIEIHENNKLRSPRWEVERQEDGQVTQRRTPVRVDLNYMVTAWANEPEDEHRILTRTLLALLRQPFLPDDLLPESLRDQPMPIPIEVAQQTGLQNLIDIWSVMDNEIRPTFKCIITLALNPYLPVTGPLVRTRELRIGQTEAPLLEQLDERAEQDQFWMVGGQVHSAGTLRNLRLEVVDRGQSVPLQPEGRFVIGNLRAGDYTLEVSAEGREPSRHKIVVPAESYDFEVS